jgi:hypothetical protein
VDKLTNAKYKGNTFAAWPEGTPLQNKMVHTLLGFPGHILATMRTKTEWTINLGADQGRGVVTGGRVR